MVGSAFLLEKKGPGAGRSPTTHIKQRGAGAGKETPRNAARRLCRRASGLGWSLQPGWLRVKQIAGTA